MRKGPAEKQGLKNNTSNDCLFETKTIITSLLREGAFVARAVEENRVCWDSDDNTYSVCARGTPCL